VKSPFVLILNSIDTICGSVSFGNDTVIVLMRGSVLSHAFRYMFAGIGMTRSNNMQVGGDHYQTMKIQPVEFIHANGLGFIEGSIIKYVCRHRQKNGRQDLAKARHFIDLLIDLEYPE